MNANNIEPERKQDLDLTILKGYLESLHRQAKSRPDCLGMKSSLELLARELEDTNNININETRMKEIMAQLSLYERTLRERLEREGREQEKYETPLEKLGKTFTGEMQI